MIDLRDLSRGVIASRQRNLIVKSRLWSLFVILCWMISGQFASGQTNYVDAAFTGATAPGWVLTHTLGTGSVLTASAAMPAAQRDVDGEGWLRLTQDLEKQSSFVYYDQNIPTSEGLVFSFDFAIWTTENRNAGDGFTLAIFKPTDDPEAGGYGGSLGYAQRFVTQGLNEAIVGFGFDAHGNFSNPNEKRVGGPGQRPNSIAYRGPMGADRDKGYEYKEGSTSLDQFYTKNKQDRANVIIHSARIAISPERTVSVAWTDKSGKWQKLVWENCDIPCPDEVMIGFTAGTGAVYANQEVRNFKVSSYTGASRIWDGGQTGSAGWSSATNWVNDVLPPFDTATDLVFSALNSDQLTNFLETDRTVRSLAFTTNTPGDVVIRTTTTLAGNGPANLTFSATGDGAAIMVPTGADGNYLIGDGAGSLILSNNLLVAHHGAGNLTLGSPVTGIEGITKSGSGTLVLTNANTYSDTTVVRGGTLLVNNTAGSGTGSGAVGVYSTATLGGDGTISGKVSVESGGRVAPGATAASVGTLKIRGDVTFKAGTTNQIDIGSDTSCDQLDLMGTGALALGSGVATLDIGPLTGESYILAANIKRNGLTGTFKDTAGTVLTDGAALPLQPGYYIHYVNKTASDDGYIEVNKTPIPAEIFGYLFIDENADQIRNSGDTTITNALVQLIVGGVEYTNTHTDSNGFYEFSEIPVGVVTVQVVQADASLVAVPSTNDVMRNRAGYSATNTAFVEYTVTSGYGVLATNLGEPLNFGYSVHPLSTRIDLKIYADNHDTVKIQIATVNENGNNDIEIYAMIDGGWTLVATVPSELIEGVGSNSYTVEAVGLTPGFSYLFKIVDESGHIFYTGTAIEVARSQLRALATSLTPEYFIMKFNTEPYADYVLKMTTSLADDAEWTDEFVQIVHQAFPTGVSAFTQRIQGAPEGVTTLRVPRNRAKAFFKLVKVD